MTAQHTVQTKKRDAVSSDGNFGSAASGFFDALVDAGVKYCFVNLGSDHPAMLEAMIRAKQDESKKIPEIITCPSELVALSAALGYAQVTGTPQCVIVHVDCGTLAMGQSIHNASIGRVPVLCFAGLSPFTDSGEMLGSRTEFIHWLQDVPDQTSIVRQYCRYSAEIRTGRNIKQMVFRAMQFATSDPKGPTYLTAAREVLEEIVELPAMGNELMGPITPCGLPDPDVELIAKTLMGAKRPLIITGYMGRNHRVPDLLANLCDRLPISVVETVGSDVSLRSDHEGYLGVTVTTHPAVCEADVIIIMDCDVPWVPTAGKPADDAKIFHLDVDPLKHQMPVFFMKAIRRYKVSCELALQQLNTFLEKQNLDRSQYAERFQARATRYQQWRKSLRDLEVPSVDGIVRVPYLISRLRGHLPEDSVLVIEAVTNAIPVIHHMNLTKPGTLYGSGAGGLGWGGGAALGVKLAKPDSFICAIVGDGTYLFSQMESVYWMARRYNVPFLLIVLNNGGWNAPKVSALLVHKDGLSSQSNRADLNLSFEPSPDYRGIAAAAGKAWSALVSEAGDVDSTLEAAVDAVKGGKCAVVEVRVPSMWVEPEPMKTNGNKRVKTG